MADRLTWDDEALRRLLESPQGPVVADLMRRGQNVENQAKLNASGRHGVEGAVNPSSRGPNVDTGRLRSSISHAPGVNQIGPFVDIGTNVWYGRRLELGWTSSRGQFFKYPFLVPALPAAAI
jgi:hypothetical protein